MLLIGSRALELRAPKLLGRKPKDFDFVCTENEFEEWKQKNSELKIEKLEVASGFQKFKKEYLKVDDVPCEFEIAIHGSSAEMMMELVQNDPETIKTDFGMIPSLDFLFLLKTSHRYLKNSPHFWKTLRDWHVLKAASCKIKPEWQDFLKFREKETYAYKHPKLEKTKKADFFADDQIKYVYDHDSIHEAVAHFEKPAYTYYQKDGEQVACDKNKFFALPEEYRLWGIIEEACVLAIERSLIPHPGKMSPEQAWKFALSKVLSSITSGWFRQWGYENCPKVLKNYPHDYFERFEKALHDGKIKPFNPDIPNNPYK